MQSKECESDEKRKEGRTGYGRGEVEGFLIGNVKSGVLLARRLYPKGKPPKPKADFPSPT
jgi:hypothetical protein